MPFAICSFGERIPHLDKQSVIEAFVAYVDEEASVRLNYEHSEFRWLKAHEAMDMVREPQTLAAPAEVFHGSIPRIPAFGHRVSFQLSELTPSWKVFRSGDKIRFQTSCFL